MLAQCFGHVADFNEVRYGYSQVNNCSCYTHLSLTNHVRWTVSSIIFMYLMSSSSKEPIENIQ